VTTHGGCPAWSDGYGTAIYGASPVRFHWRQLPAYGGELNDQG
jgi:hypothetical protein